MIAGNGAVRPRLSICIPAYKRPKFLDKCLRAAIAAIGNEDIPIIVADDSCDNTNAEVIGRLKAQFPLLTWYRNDRNLGIDANILFAVSLSDADYAWLLGEDDLLTPQSVQRVLAVLRTQSPGFIFANYSYVSNDYKYCLKGRVAPVSEDSDLPITEFVERYAWAMGFIGACIVCRKSWVQRSEFIGTYYAHVASIILSAGESRVRMIAEPLVLNRAENARSFSWSAKAFDVFFGWEDMLRRVHALNPSFNLGVAIRNSGVLFRHRKISWLASKRADGVYDLKLFRSDPRIGGDSRVGRFLRLLVAVTPRSLCQIAKFLARDMPRLFRRRRIVMTIPPLTAAGFTGPERNDSGVGTARQSTRN